MHRVRSHHRRFLFAAAAAAVAAAAGAGFVSPLRAGDLDPLLDSQWHLKSRAEEPAGANVRAAWPSARGFGVVVGIVDDGLQGTHEDLAPNYIASLSHDFVDGDADPSAGSGDAHGTAVAGIIAARGDNGLGVSGVAPLAGIAGLRLTAGRPTDAQVAAAMQHELQSIDILMNSYGLPTLSSPGPLTKAAIENAITTGRHGRGRIFVWATRDYGYAALPTECNRDPYASRRFAIAVGALADTGAWSRGSCSALMVTAPSSGGSRGLTTTDLMGTGGYSTGDYTTTTTSFGRLAGAAAVVSGVVALMLEKNPSLTWRDVQHILVRTSRKVNPAEAGWSNGLFPHHERYGFGLVDAEAAVAMADAWSPVASEAAIPEITQAVNATVPNLSSTGVTNSITIGSEYAGFRVEHVEVQVFADGDYEALEGLNVTLTSPSGVSSRLVTQSRDSNPRALTTSVRHWGETAQGTWTLKVWDDGWYPYPVLWKSWTLAIYGTAAAGTSVRGDFTGDGRADVAVYRPSTGTWYVRNQMTVQYGNAGDIPVAGDYNGDGVTEIAVYRPTGYWYVFNQAPVSFGNPGDIPVPADYDGDGDTDFAVYRPSTGVWLIRNQFDLQWGNPGDIPVPADYDGDGDDDVAVYRPSTGVWYVNGQVETPWGSPGDVPVPADYDGDGDDDVAVYRPSTGVWYVRGQFEATWGGPGDVPVPRDYDGDGDVDLGVFRASTGQWMVRDHFIVPFGAPGDLPVPRDQTVRHGTPYDFDGNGTADVGVYRPSTGVWYVADQFAEQFGNDGDRTVPGDYNGDGVTDIAVYRPSTGVWYVRDQLAVQFGNADDVPVPADYNGDGITDVAVYRPSTGMWYVRDQLAVQFGDPDDIPVPADYNGDGMADIAVYRPSTGVWYVRNQFEVQFGNPDDVPVPGDYNDDGVADVAIYRPSNGVWYVRNQFEVQWGNPGDQPVPADFDGDGAIDIAVYRPSNGVWYVRDQFMVQFGNPGDRPLIRVIGRSTDPPAPTESGGSTGGSTCTTEQPAPGWVCVNGGWVPPDHPLARR